MTPAAFAAFDPLSPDPAPLALNRAQAAAYLQAITGIRTTEDMLSMASHRGRLHGRLPPPFKKMGTRVVYEVAALEAWAKQALAAAPEMRTTAAA